jgi:transposase
MCLKPSPKQPVSAQTAAVARAAFPKGNLYLKIRDELGAIFADEQFDRLYPERGQPGLPPWHLALVTIFQFLESLSDRQAAEAVRARIDWKYALGLELTDPGFDFSVLSEFRARLIAGAAEQILLDTLLALFRERGLLKVRGRQRTDSTHVLAAIRVMNRLELVTETLRAALNALAEVAPDWLRSFAPADWYERYGQRAEQSRMPHKEPARTRFAQQVGADGFRVLDALQQERTDLLAVPAVKTLQLTWERHFARGSNAGDESGNEGGRGDDGRVGIVFRDSKDLTRAAQAIESPYDTEARHSSKREIVWTGYKVNLTETCEPDHVHLITNVHTSVATEQDVSCTESIHQSLARRDLLPGRHLVDTGYVDAELLVASQETYQVELFGPTRYGASWRAREGGVDRSQFRIDWEKRQTTCPEGKTSLPWPAETVRRNTIHGKRYEYPATYVRFSVRDCQPCPSRARCVRSPGKGRTLTLGSRLHEEALQLARSRIVSAEGRLEYQKRCGHRGDSVAGASGLRPKALSVRGLGQDAFTARGFGGGAEPGALLEPSGRPARGQDARVPLRCLAAGLISPTVSGGLW